MAADDRKKRIMEHLARSSDNMKFVSPKKAINPPAPTISPLPPSQPTPAKVDDRKTRIKEHLSRSSGDFDKLSLSSEQRKKRIQNHIRITMGQELEQFEKWEKPHNVAIERVTLDFNPVDQVPPTVQEEAGSEPSNFGQLNEQF